MAFPKARRLLRPPDFRQVYDLGFKVVCRTFVAFCWKAAEADGPKTGFTTPRTLGKAVKRNRMRRRLRETVRRRLARLGPEWRIVWNLRRPALDAPQEVLDSEVERVFERCNG
jgi:ribonuclease P protein component